MEPPSRLLWRSSIPTVLHIAIVVSRTLLHKKTTQKINLLGSNRLLQKLNLEVDFCAKVDFQKNYQPNILLYNKAILHYFPEVVIFKCNQTCSSARTKRVALYSEQTLAGELDNMERMLMQIELTVIAGDHESYKISVQINNAP